MKACKWIVCLLLCCLLCGCGASPLTHPPGNSLIVGTPWVQFAGGQIVAADVATADAADSTLQYSYQQEGQISTCAKQRGETAQQGVLTYQTYQKVTELILQKLQAQELLLQGQTIAYNTVQSQTLTYRRSSAVTARMVRATSPGTKSAEGIFRGYFCYNIHTGDLPTGERGSIFDTNETPLAFLVLTQVYTEPVVGGPDHTETEYVYIFLME